jgi:UDP-3-O-[3-hydroxymyristoyl] N-acetylglucosamine deacetylase
LIHEPSGFRFAGSEHLLAALAGLELWDTILDVKGDEIPVLDGSAALFAQRLVRSSNRGRTPTEPLTLQEPIRVQSRDGFVEAVPAEVTSIHICIDFENPQVGRQRWSWKRDPDSFLGQLASARTFGFTEDLPELRALGLASGADLECALVFGPDSVLNPEGPRFPEEPVRHKLLDVLGDLALLGRPLLARVEAERPSHGLVHRLVEAMLES